MPAERSGDPRSSRNPRQAFLNDVAKRLNVTPAQLNSALKGAAIDQLDAAVKAGKLTQAQANALKQRIQQGAHGGAPFGSDRRARSGSGLVGPGPLLRRGCSRTGRSGDALPRSTSA